MKKNIILLVTIFLLFIIAISLTLKYTNILSDNISDNIEDEIIIDYSDNISDNIDDEIIIDYSDNNFNSNLIQKVNKQDNYLISPYSIELAFNLLKEGADGDTLKELNSVIPNRKINDLTSNKVKVSNAAFIKNIYKNYIENNYINTLKNNYKSEILFDEFKNPDKINNWVKDKTDGMIDKVVEQIDNDFVLGLVNALAINVNWLDQFDCGNTNSREFTKIDNSKINVEMMFKTYSNNASYFEDKDSKGVVIPYEDNLEFIGILPNNINNYINNLTDDKLKNINGNINASNNININVFLPRFTYDYKLEKNDFKNVLNKMGIKLVFDQDKSNLEKIINKSNLNKLNINNLYVSEAIHKTHIELSETGTKAAAVSYLGIFKNTSMEKEEKKYYTIEFNKPFLYMIRNKNNKEILFFGSVYEPNLWNGSTCSEN